MYNYNKPVYIVRRSVSCSQQDLSHAGMKGMKWGYNDGVRNGKKTANDRADEYDRQMTENTIKSGNEESQKKYASNARDKKEHGEKAKEYYKKAKTAEKNRNTARSLSYKLGFAAGRTVRECSKQVNKGKSYLKKFLR